MNKLKPGDPAPDFSLPGHHRGLVSITDFRDKIIVLYFYPKDDTPGCTKEACGFRDAFDTFKKRKAVVLGVSPDTVEKHEKFAGKYQLPFILLSDENKDVCRAYGVWVRKSMYGRSYMGVARTTFIIGRDGRIEHIFEKVKPQGHEQDVEAFLKQMLKNGR